MKKFLSVVVALAFVTMGAVALNHGAEEHADEQMTVQGEIVDMACYVAHEAKGPDHQECAARCVKGGQPMGLLADDGTLYLLYASHADGAAFESAKDLAGLQVELSGKLSTQGGVNGLEVASVKKSGS